MNGIQPIPPSTETNFNLGKRSSSPETIRLQMILALLMNIIVEPIASFDFDCRDGQGELPYQLAVASLEPM